MPQPLHDLVLEQAVLGAVLRDWRTLERLPPLTAETFYDPLHGQLWTWLEEGARIGRPLDERLLAARAQEHPGLGELGGMEYLGLLLSQAGLPSESVLSVHYARRLQELAVKRGLEAALLASLEALREHDTSAGDLVSQAEQAIRALDCSEHAGRSLEEAFDAWLEQVQDPNYRPMLSGFTALDRRLGGFWPGDLVIIAGRPSMGKTALAANLARGFAYRGYPVHFASLEMGDVQLAQRSASAVSWAERAIPYQQMRGGEGLDLDYLRRLRERLPKGIHIDARGGQTVSQIRAAARATRRRHGKLGCVIVDYLQIMGGAGGSRYEKITEISAGLKALAKDLNVPVIALSQLSRANEGREDKRPTLSDLRESGAIEQDADVVLGVYREHYYLSRQPEPTDDEAWNRHREALERSASQCEVITLKQRQGPIGSDLLEMHVEYDVAMDAPQHWGRKTA